MYEIKFIARKFAIGRSLVCLFVIFSSLGFANSRLSDVSAEELKERINSMPSQIEMRYTNEIHGIINTYIRHRSSSEKLLGLSQVYFPLYELELQKLGLPEELKYLSVVESSLRPEAISKVGAAGLWQFMKGTARLYGLTVNSAVDERRDIFRSTEAASKYLKDLYAEFGDWTLALAAYNCGPGNVQRALKNSGGSAFWDIKSRLPRETRRYVPKFVAVSYFMNYSQFHGLEPLNTLPVEYIATAKIFEYYTFADISKITGVDIRTIKELNPAYLKNYIPNNSKGYTLTLPENAMYLFLSSNGGYENLIYTTSTTKKEKIYMFGQMRSRLNEVQSSEVLPVVLQLKQSSMSQGNSGPLSDLPAPPKMVSPKAIPLTNRNYVYHKLNAQQSLVDVAQLYNVQLDDILSLNKIDIHNPPAPGTLVRIE